MSSYLTRFSLTGVHMEMDPRGGWVSAAGVAAELADRDREIERLRKQLDAVAATSITRPDGYQYHWLPGQGWRRGHKVSDAGAGDQNRCPECGGLRYAWEVVANGVGGFPPEKVSCPACGGTGKIPAEKLGTPAGEPSELESSDEGAGDKTSGAVGPTASSDGIDTPDRQSGEGPAGSSPNLPADLIDRAIWAADREYSSTSFTTAAPHSHRLCAAVKGVAPLLVEHGRIEGKSEAWGEVYRSPGIQRLEREAEARGAEQEKTRWETRLLAALNREGRSAEGAVDAFEALGPRYAVELLRSLLTEEGENGE